MYFEVDNDKHRLQRSYSSELRFDIGGPSTRADNLLNARNM